MGWFSAGAAERPLCGAYQGAQGRIDGLFVREICGNVGRKEDEIRSCSIARDIFAADTAIQLRQVVLCTQLVSPLSFFSFFLHTVFVRAASFCGR